MGSNFREKDYKEKTLSNIISMTISVKYQQIKSLACSALVLTSIH